MRKCLAKYPHSIILSDYDLRVKTYLYRVSDLFTDLQCQIHDHDFIIAICIDATCEEFQKILWYNVYGIVSLKCIINDHPHQSSNILMIQEIKQKREKLFKLLSYLTTSYTNNTNPSIKLRQQGEYAWLQSCILNGEQTPYPTLTFDNVFNTMQDTFLANMDDMRSQVEKSVHSLQNNTQKFKKIQEFKQKMEDIIKTTQSQIYLNFQSILMEESNEQKSTDAKSMPQGMTINLSQIEQQNDFQTEIPQGSFDFQPNFSEIVIKCDDNIIPFMPTLSFIDKTLKRGFLGSKPKVKFEQGGKIITMSKNTIIVSQELFYQDNIEIRIRMQSFVSGCCHFGIVEQSALELTKNVDKIGYWACLNSECKQCPKLSKVQDFTLLMDSIIGLNLNFSDDTIHLRLFTRDAVTILSQKSGCLMKKKYMCTFHA